MLVTATGQTKPYMPLAGGKSVNLIQFSVEPYRWQMAHKPNNKRGKNANTTIPTNETTSRVKKRSQPYSLASNNHCDHCNYSMVTNEYIPATVLREPGRTNQLFIN